MENNAGYLHQAGVSLAQVHTSIYQSIRSRINLQCHNSPDWSSAKIQNGFRYISLGNFKVLSHGCKPWRECTQRQDLCCFIFLLYQQHYQYRPLNLGSRLVWVHDLDILLCIPVKSLKFFNYHRIKWMYIPPSGLCIFNLCCMLWIVSYATQY